ncbi:hypothetical protein BDP81DRAFT_434381 [Colletotrichum phormii]|uniref:Uncharacterized protein n=1 Tax=Colletotrichum phormii TaxID=359342 RepID=A0AAI9ZKT0_9PEZI|nr:uncharacterized protein BDP81DRAFT_434381 [Colletotrichum phormii]KAK1633754.1 hypothetical protein BDP81DRAFT_434381 [Colletotrichum phormii]
MLGSSAAAHRCPPSSLSLTLVLPLPVRGAYSSRPAGNPIVALRMCRESLIQQEPDGPPPRVPSRQACIEQSSVLRG